MRVNLLEKFEARHAKREGLTLVVGSRIYGPREDRRKRYARALGVDIEAGDGVDVVADLEDIAGCRSLIYGHYELLHYDHGGMFAHVECMSVLEHVKRPWLMAESIESMMLPGSTIMLTVPFVWWVHSYPSDYWRMTTEAVRSIFPRIDWAELVYANTKLGGSGKIPSLFDADEHRYLARTEVYGFGARA